MNIIFAKTRWDYQSYIDYWRLVELSGFPIVYVDQMDVNNPDNIYIVSPANGEIHSFDKSNYKSKVVLWNLERPGGSGSVEKYANDNHEMLNKYFNRIVVSDRSLAKICNLDYITLGIHPDFGIPGSYDDKWFDVIHLSCYSNHRSWMFDYPDKPKAVLGGSIAVAPNGWGEERDRRLQQSKFMLATHQDRFPFMEPLRFALATIYGLHIISETCLDPYPYTLIPMGDLESAVKDYNYAAYVHGIYLRDLMAEKFTFRMCVEDCIQRIFS